MTRSITEIREGNLSGPITSYVKQANVASLNPFVLWDHYHVEQVSGTTGFGFHGHSGVATISVPITGSISHEDTGGHSGILMPDGIQVMSSGSGVLHKETVHPDNGTAEAFQLWTLLPSESAEMGAVTYSAAQQIDIPVVEVEGSRTRVLIGTHDGATSPVQHSVPITYLNVVLGHDVRWEHLTTQGQTAGFIYVRSGAVTIAGIRVETHQMGVLDASDSALELIAGSAGAELMIALGQPLDQAIISSGSSIHSTLENLHSGTNNIRTLIDNLRNTQTYSEA